MSDVTKHGELILQETGDRISGATTATEFCERTIVKQGMIRHIGKDLRISVGDFTINDQLFKVTVHFAGNTIKRVELFAITSDEGKSWDDWTLEREMNRKKLHEAWTLRSFGKPMEVRPLLTPNRVLPFEVKDDTARYAQFDWGQVCSWYDSKGGFAYMTIDYGASL